MTQRPPEAPRRRKLLVHQDVLEWMDDPRSDRQLQQRARLVFSQLAAQGMPPQVKGVQGLGRGWLRTDLGGNSGHQFYLWWARAGSPPVKHLGLDPLEILVRAVRHHDETHAALDPGGPDQWVSLPGQELKDNGLFPELLRSQQDAIESKVRLRVLRGQPGTGKTTVLQQAALGAPGQRTLYLTYNALLAERARDFFDQFAPDPSLVTVLTFGELLRRVLPAAPAVVAPLAERITVLARALDSAPRKFAPWDKHPEELFGELHAWIAGAALPTPFRGAPPCEGQLLREEAFVKLRAKTLDERAARNAVQAVQALDPRLLPEIVGDPWWARRALDKVRAGAKPPKVFADLHAVFVDEVQDLTLVEIALLAALVSAASEGREAPLDVMVAGDESQTVRPTDFDWGAFADAVAPTLGPGSTFDLLGNVRSPRAIATLVERSWSLYQHLDKAQRPRGRADLEIEESVSGRVLRCRVPDVATLARVGRALLERPSTVLVFPGARVPPELQPDGLDVWSSDAVKGLDFSVVAVVDGARRIREIEALRARKNDQVQSLRARTRADQFRVALSRATDTVIFLDVGEDPSGDGALHRLCVDDQEGPLEGYVASIDPDALLALLARDDASAQELVLEYIQEAAALLHAHPRRALDRLRHARGLLGRADSRCGVSDPTIRRQVHRLLGRAAWINASQQGSLDGAELMEEARKALQLGEMKLAAKASLLVRDLVRGDADSGASAESLLALRPQVLTEFAELREPLDRALRSWAASREAALLPTGRTARVKLLDAVGGVRALFVDDLPETARVERSLRRRVAVALREESHGREALDVLLPLDPRDRAEEARCHEVLGQLREASLAWEESGDLVAALRCARELPDLDRALALAVRTGSDEASALRWACSLRDLLSGHRAEAEGLNEHERGALARAFDDALPSRSGARRRRG
ncbi:MAG: hypothetical protein EPO40_36470 [Myxococcaceae bacterium]|nr:MAG: hypothetical protein EPO40_36470 [Myxococcaceae bacterium]